MDWDPDQVAAGNPVTVPEDLYIKGCLNDVDEGIQAAKKIGFPVMIKASEGGGGKGIRQVENEADFPSAFRQVQIVSYTNAFRM